MRLVGRRDRRVDRRAEGPRGASGPGPRPVCHLVAEREELRPLPATLPEPFEGVVHRKVSGDGLIAFENRSDPVRLPSWASSLPAPREWPAMLAGVEMLAAAIGLAAAPPDTCDEALWRLQSLLPAIKETERRPAACSERSQTRTTVGCDRRWRPFSGNREFCGQEGGLLQHGLRRLLLLVGGVAVLAQDALHQHPELRPHVLA